jgi:hypothetical protein
MSIDETDLPGNCQIAFWGSASNIDYNARSSESLNQAVRRAALQQKELCT